MKKLFTLFAAMFCAAVVMAGVTGQLVIPDAEHAIITVTRSDAPLANGDAVTTGDELVIHYEPDFPYRIDGDRDVRITLIDSYFEEESGNFYFKVDAPSVLLLDPEISLKLLAADRLHIEWQDYSMYESFRLLVSPEEPKGNPDYWKGVQHLAGITSVEAEGLVEGLTYYIYLEGTAGSYVSNWVVETIVMREPGDPCELTISMQDSYGDGWNGNYIEISEGGESVVFALNDYVSKRTETYISFGEPAEITWHNPGGYTYPEEASFQIVNGEGTTLYRVNAGEATDWPDGIVLFNGQLCGLMCYLENLAGVADGTNFTVSWDVYGTDSVEVAVVQTMNPTAEQLDAAKIGLNGATSYSFTGTPHMAYNVFVRPVHEKAVPQKWQSILVFEGIVYSESAVAAIAEPLTSSYKESGELMERALIGVDGPDYYPLRVFSLDLADSTEVEISCTSSTIVDWMISAWQDTAVGKPWKMIDMTDAGSLKVKLVGKNYIIISNVAQFGDYEIAVMSGLTPIVISNLDYFTTGDFTDAEPWIFPYTGDVIDAKMYSFTPADTIHNATIAFSAPDFDGTMPPALYYFLFRNILDMSSGRVADNNPGDAITAELIADSTYYIVICSLPQYGGKPEFTYRLAVVDKDAPTSLLVPVAIELDQKVEGDLTDAVRWEFPYTSDIAYAKAYSFTPADTMKVRISTESSSAISGMYGPATYCMVYLNEIDALKEVCASEFNYPKDVEMIADSTYIIVVSAIPAFGGLPSDDYSLVLTEAIPHTYELHPRVIDLDFAEMSDFLSAEPWEFPYTGQEILARAFSITPADTVDVTISFTSPDYKGGGVNPPSMYYFVFKDTLDMSKCEYSNQPGSDAYLTLIEDTTYYVVLCDLTPYGGQPEDTYLLRIVDDNTPTQAILIAPDTIITDAITELDRIKEWDEYGKVYEFVLTKDTTVGFSIEYLGDDPNMLSDLRVEVYTELTGSSLSTMYAYYKDFNYYQLDGAAAGAHYYMVVSANGNLCDYRITLRANPDFDNLPVKDSIAVNTPYRSALSVEDGFTYHNNDCDPYWRGDFEAYKVHLEQDKNYALMMHVLSVDGDNARENFEGFAASIFQPGVATGTYMGNVLESNCRWDDEDWAFVIFQAPSTDDYIVMFDSYFYSKYLSDSIVYEFSVEEVINLLDLAPISRFIKTNELPYAESGVFTDNKKVLSNVIYNFQTSIEGAYDAVAYGVRVAADDTLFAEFGGDVDATIQIYDLATFALLKTIDDEPYNYPNESGYVVNEGTDSVNLAVVCSFNEMRITDAAWSVRISTKEKDFEPVIVTPKASAESITIYESDGVEAAMAKLGELNLIAVDGDEHFVCTLVNNPLLWEVNVNTNTALYEFNDQDLPLGYQFQFSTDYVEVAIERIPDLPSAFNEIETVTVPALKVLRNGQIYIVTEFGTFDIFGRKVQ